MANRDRARSRLSPDLRHRVLRVTGLRISHGGAEVLDDLLANHGLTLDEVVDATLRMVGCGLVPVSELKARLR